MYVVGRDKPSRSAGMKTAAIRIHAHVTTVVLQDTGHWVMEERLKETMDALMRFL